MLDGIDQMLEITAKTVKLPYYKNIPTPQRLKTIGQTGPVILFAGGPIIIDML
jgi:hypothetical protein